MASPGQPGAPSSYSASGHTATTQQVLQPQGYIQPPQQVSWGCGVRGGGMGAADWGGTHCWLVAATRQAQGHLDITWSGSRQMAAYPGGAQGLQLQCPTSRWGGGKVEVTLRGSDRQVFFGGGGAPCHPTQPSPTRPPFPSQIQVSYYPPGQYPSSSQQYRTLSHPVAYSPQRSQQLPQQSQQPGEGQGDWGSRAKEVGK